jgi:hypothetical protein
MWNLNLQTKLSISANLKSESPNEAFDFCPAMVSLSQNGLLEPTSLDFVHAVKVFY